MPPREEIAVLRDTLVVDDLFAALRSLNHTTDYRFTGIYLFEGKWVKSLLLFDRECPNVQIGHDVLWDDSYCRMTATGAGLCEITDSRTDARLTTHAAREAVQCYCAVSLCSPDGTPLGSLCHYDVRPRQTAAQTFAALKEMRPRVQELLWGRLTAVTESFDARVQGSAPLALRPVGGLRLEAVTPPATP